MVRGADRVRHSTRHAGGRGRTVWAFMTAVALSGGLVSFGSAASSAADLPALSITTTSNAASGGAVHAGQTITFTVTASSPKPLATDATIIIDLSGLLGNASVAETPAELTTSGLALDPAKKTLTWAEPASSISPSVGAHTSFRATVTADVSDGTVLTTAAFAEGDSCAAGDPCATTLTVVQPSPTPSSPAPVSPAPVSPAPVSPAPVSPAPVSQTPPATPLPTGTQQSPIDSPTASSPVSPGATPAKPTSSPSSTATAPQRAKAVSPVAPAAAPACTGADAVAGSPLAGFEIDGNLCTDTASNLDWDSVGGQPVADDGAGDATQFTSGASENSWPWTPAQIAGAGSAPGKTDMTNVYAFTQTVGDVYAYLGFERDVSVGSVAYHVELNKLPNSAGPTPNRSVGDLRLTIDQAGSRTLRLVGADTWTGSDWQSLGSLAGFVGQVNQVPVNNLSGTILISGKFTEVGIDLTTLFGPTCSGNYGTLNIRSSSSPSDNSSLGDWIAPVALNVPDTCPSVVVGKTWVIDGTTFANGTQPAGFSASLTLTGRTNPQFGVTYTTRSNGTRYQTGDVVTVGEVISPLPPGCSHAASGDSGAHALVSGPNSFAITNTVTCTFLTLEKAVVGGTAEPDQWTLSASGPTNVSGPGNSAAVTRVHVAPGQYALSENGPASYRQTSLTCTPKAASGSTVTLAVGDNVTCTFTNTAAHPVVLTKVWQNAIPGNAVDLTITDGGATGTGSSTAPSTTTNATLQVVAFDTVALAETFTTGNPAHYSSTLACDNGVSVTSGSFTVPSSLDAGTTITCTFTNARHSATLTLQKSWVNGALDDTADLSIDGAATGPAFATATAPPPNGNGLSTEFASESVFAGDTIALSEVLGAGNTGTYGADLTCTDSAGLTYTAGARSGSYTVPTAPVDVICTFSNTRTSTSITLQKIWVNAAAGDTARLSIAGSDAGTIGSATSTATGAAGSETDAVNQAVASIFSGETVSLVEDLGATNTGSYTSQIACSPSGGLTPGEGGQGGTYQVPATPTPVTCTITNTRTSATMTLQKDWVNGASGDTADLSIDGATSGSGLTTATAPPSGIGLSTDKATLTLLSGSTVTLAETLGSANTGSYTSRIACTPADGLTANGPGQGGTYQVPATPVPVVCTFANVRTSASMTLRKEWVNGAAGDTADLSISGAAVAAFGSSTSTATGVAGSQLDTVNQAHAIVFSGGTVDVAEVLGTENTGSYSSQIVCDQPGLTPDRRRAGRHVPGTRHTCGRNLHDHQHPKLDDNDPAEGMGQRRHRRYCRTLDRWNRASRLSDEYVDRQRCQADLRSTPSTKPSQPSIPAKRSSSLKLSVAETSAPTWRRSSATGPA